MTNYYSPKEIAEYCGVSPSSVSHWMERKLLPEPEITSVAGNVKLWSETQVEEAKKAFLTRKPRGRYSKNSERRKQ